MAKIQRLQLRVVFRSISKQESTMGSHFLQTPFTAPQAKGEPEEHGKLRGIA